MPILESAHTYMLFWFFKFLGSAGLEFKKEKGSKFCLPLIAHQSSKSPSRLSARLVLRTLKSFIDYLYVKVYSLFTFESLKIKPN